MRILAVGDLHGCYDALEALSQFVPFQEDDFLVMLGDYVDRGPHSYETVEWVRQRVLNGRCVALRGNHEIMMVDALHGEFPWEHWLQYGGRECLDSYARVGGTRSVQDIPDEHVEFLDQTLLAYYETESHIFVHATVAENVPLNEQSPRDLYWERFESLQPHQSGKTVICGHTAQKSGLPADHGFGICIDTWAYGKGWLTCLDVETGEYWQANQKRQTRQGRLPGRR